jgi:hypothetical protein
MLCKLNLLLTSSERRAYVDDVDKGDRPIMNIVIDQERLAKITTLACGNVKFHRGWNHAVTAEQLAEQLLSADEQIRNGTAERVTDIDGDLGIRISTARSFDPIILGLLARLPKSGEVWAEAERKPWLQLLEGSFKLIYN